MTDKEQKSEPQEDFGEVTDKLLKLFDSSVEPPDESAQSRTR
jgi:hypothetical protein